MVSGRCLIWTGDGNMPDQINGNFRILKWRYLSYIRPIFQAYVREYPHKICPYMVQYLHFRILKFPSIKVLHQELGTQMLRYGTARCIECSRFGLSNDRTFFQRLARKSSAKQGSCWVIWGISVYPMAPNIHWFWFMNTSIQKNEY